MKSWKMLLIGLVAGGTLMAGGSVMAGDALEFRLVKALYPLLVDGTEYRSEELPVLNYQGFTYVPLRAMGDLLGAGVQWNEARKRVEIGLANPPGTFNNTAFRNVRAQIDSDGKYTVTGETRVFEAVFFYAVSDGHDEVVGPETLHAAAGAPNWSPFTLQLDFPQAQRPANGTLTLELFEQSAKDGSRIHELSVPLQTFHP